MEEYDKRFFKELVERIESRLIAIDNTLGCLVIIGFMIALCLLARNCTNG